MTNTLLRKSKNKDNNSANQQQQQHASLKRNVSEDFERDAEGSLHESVIVETRSPPSIIDEEVPTLKMVKFIYSEKSSPTYVAPVKSKVKISQNFVAFSEYIFDLKLCFHSYFLNDKKKPYLDKIPWGLVF